MRISFCGASGTGKSTLAAFVAEKYGIPINPVGSRSVAAAMGFASPYDVDAAGKRAEFQRRLLTDKLAWEAEHESFVVDRTPLDNLLYTCMHDVSAVDEEMIETVRAGIARYTHIIYCPVGAFCNVGEDAARVKSMAYHRVYDMALVGFMLKYLGVIFDLGDGSFVQTGPIKVSYYSIQSADLEERKQETIKFIDKWRV